MEKGVQVQDCFVVNDSLSKTAEEPRFFAGNCLSPAGNGGTPVAAQSIETLLNFLCTQRPKVALHDRFFSLGQWWDFFRGVRANWIAPIDQAIVGGFESDRLAYASASGIQCALRKLVPAVDPNGIVSICITEEGGGHPKALKTSLDPAGSAYQGHWILRGEKKWATLSLDSETLLVAAVRGSHPDGRSDIAMVKIPTHAAGVAVNPMPQTPFTPEITHGQVVLQGVAVPESAILPGDGYTKYIRPFRTVEDAFVSAAMAGLMLRIGFASAWPEETLNQVFQLIAVLRIVSTADHDDASIHVLLHGALAALKELGTVEGHHWERAPSQVRDRWARDIPLAGIAGKAREQRFESAWERMGKLGKSGTP